MTLTTTTTITTTTATAAGTGDGRLRICDATPFRRRGKDVQQQYMLQIHI
jgi:hypothetical protein